MDEEERLRKVEAGKEKLAAYRLKKRALEKNERRRTEQGQISSTGSSPHRSLEIVLQDDASEKQDRQEDMLQILQMRVRDLEEIISGKTSALEAALEEINVLKAENAIEKDAHHKLVLNFQKGIAQRDALIEKLTSTVQESMQTRAALETEGEHLAQVVASLQNQLQKTTDIVQGQQWPNTVKETMYIDLVNQKLALEVKLQSYEAEIHSLQRSVQLKQQELKQLTAQLRKEQLSSELEIKSLKLQMEHLHSNYKVIVKEYKDSITQHCSEYEEKLHHLMEVKNVHRYHFQPEKHMKEITVLKNMLLKLSLHVESTDCDKHEIGSMLNELRGLIEMKEMSSQQFYDIVDSNDLLSNALNTVKLVKQQFKILVADLDLTKCDLKKCKDSYERTLDLQRKEVIGYKFNLSELPNMQAMYNILPESSNGCDTEMSDTDQIPVLRHLKHCISKEDHFLDFHFACLSSLIMKLVKAKEDIKDLDSQVEKNLNYKEILGKERENFSPGFDEHMNLFIEKIKDFIKAVDLSIKMQPITDEFCRIDSSYTEKNQLEAFGEKDEKSMTHSESIHYKECIDAIEMKLNDSVKTTTSILNDTYFVKERYLKDIYQLSASVTNDNLKEIVLFKQMIDSLEVQVLELSDHEEGIFEKLQEARNDWEKNQMEAAAFKSVFFDYKEMIERLQKYTCALKLQTSNELLPESYWDLFKISVGSLDYYKKITSHCNHHVSILKKQLEKKDKKINCYRRQLSEYQRSLEKYKTLFTADEPISKILKSKLRSKEFMDMVEGLSTDLKETREKVCTYQSGFNIRRTEMDLDRQRKEVSTYAEFLTKYHAFLEIYRQQIDTEMEEVGCKDSKFFILEEGQKCEERQVLLERQIEALKSDLLLATQLISLLKVEKEVLLHSYEAEVKIYKDELCQLVNNLQKSRETKQNLLQASLKPGDKHVTVFNKMIQDEMCDLTFNFKPTTDLEKEVEFVKTVKQKVVSDSTDISDEYNFANCSIMALEELAVQYLKAQGIIAAKEEIQSTLEKRISELEDAYKKVNLIKEANTELLEAIVHYLKLYGLVAAKDEIEESLLVNIEHLENSLHKLLNVHREKAEEFIPTDDLQELDQIRSTVMVKCKELKNVKSMCKYEIVDVISDKIKKNNNDETLFLLQQFKQQEPEEKAHLLNNDIVYTEIMKSGDNTEDDEKSKTFSAAIIAAEGGEHDYLANSDGRLSVSQNNLFSRFAIKLLRHSQTLEKEKIKLANRIKKHNLQLQAKGLEDYVYFEDQKNLTLQYRQLSELVHLKARMNQLVHENAQYKHKIGVLMYQNQICHEAKAFLLRELELERMRTEEKVYNHDLTQCVLQLQNGKPDAVENLLQVLDSKGKEVINLKEHLRLIQTAADECRGKLETAKRDEASQKATINFLKDQVQKLCDELRAVWRKNFELQCKLGGSEKETSILKGTAYKSLSWDKEKGADSHIKSWTQKRECVHEDLYSAMEEITGQVEALSNALNVIRSEYKKVSLEMQALRNSVNKLEVQNLSTDDDMDTLDKKINQILQRNGMELNLNDAVAVDDFENSEQLKKLQEQNSLLRMQLEKLQSCLRDRETQVVELKSKLEREIQIQKLNVQHWKLEVQAKQCESYVEKALRIHDDQDNTATGDNILYKEWEEQIERIQSQLEEVHQETLVAMKAHWEEQFSVRERELQQKFNAELLHLKQEHLEELSQLQKQLDASKQKMEVLTLKELNQELGSWSSFENADTKDLEKVKERLHAELEEILSKLDQKQRSICDLLKEKFEAYYLHQIATALKIARESINSLHEQEISALKSQYETEMSVMQTKLQIDGYEKVLKVQQELHKKHKDEINNVTKHLEVEILKMKQLYNPRVGSTLLSQIRKHTCLEYTAGLKKLIEVWVADFKHKLDKLNKDTEKHLSQGTSEEIISITELMESKEQIVSIATGLQNELMKCLQKCLESIGSQIESANFRLKRELEVSNEAMEKAILQTKLEKALKENEELVKGHKFAMEYQMSEHSREMAKLHAQISDGTAVIALRQELEAKHNKEMEELRKYFEKKCAELEQNYSEEVFMKRKSKSSGNSSEEEFLTEMYSPQHLTPLTHICDTYPESNKKETNTIHGPNNGKQIECTYQVDVPALEFDYDCCTWLLKTKEDFESKLEKIFQDLFTMCITDVLGGEIAGAEDSSSKSHFPEEQRLKNISISFEKRFEGAKKLLVGIHRNELDELKGLYEESINRQIKAISRQIKEKGEKNILAIKYELYEKQRKAVSKMEEQLGDLMVDKMGKASAELVLQKLENEWKFHDEVEKRSEEESREKTLHLQKEMEDKFERELKSRIEVERKLLKEEYDEMAKGLRKSLEVEQESKLSSIMSELKELHEYELEQVRASYERRLHEEVELSKHEIIRALEEQIQVLLAEDIDDISHPRELVQLQEKFAAQYKKEIALLKEQHSQEVEKLKEQLESRCKQPSAEDVLGADNENFGMATGSQAENVSVADEELKRFLDLEQLNKERVSLQKANALLKDLVCELTRYVCLCENTVNDAINKSLKLDTDDSRIKQDESLSCTMDGTSGREGAQAEEKNESYGMALEMPVKIRECSAGHSAILSTLHMFHFTPDVSNILSLIEDQTLGDTDENDRDVTLNLQAELNNCLKRLNVEANAIMMLSNGFKNKNQESDNGTSVTEGKLYTVTKKLEEEIKAKEALQVELEKLQAEANTFMSFQDAQQEIQRLKESCSLELYAAHKRIMELENELGSKEIVSEGFGQINQSQLSRRLENLNQLQDRARSVLSESALDIQNAPHLQLIEELCYEGDRLSEDARKEREDLQLQVEAADKQLRATRQFLEEQAAEREQERDEFLSEIAKLQDQLRERDRDLSEHNRLVKEIEGLEEQVKEAVMQKLAAEASKEELESELKANNDKVWCLRDIITDLESQIQAKTQYEATLEQQLHELHKILEHQKRNHEELVEELETLRRDSGKAELAEHISHLEEQLQKHRLHVEQFQSNSTAVRLMKAQLRELEATVDRKTKDLESLHAANSSASCSSPSEDISIRDQLDATRCDTPEEAFITSSPVCLPLDELHRLQDKLQRHSRAEEVALKKIRDLEMQLKNAKKNEEEAVMEKDTLQSEVEEQQLKISKLESKLIEYQCLKEDMCSELQSKLDSQEKQLKETRDAIGIKEEEVKELKETLNQLRALAVTQEKEWNIKYMNEVDTVSELKKRCQELENDKQRLENLLEKMQKSHSLHEQDKMLEQSEFKTDPSCLMKSEQSEPSLDIKGSKLENLDTVSDSDGSSKESKILDVETSEKKDNLLDSTWASDIFAASVKHLSGDSALMDNLPSPEPIPYYSAEQTDLNNQDYITQLKTAVDKSLIKLEVYEGELNFLNNRVTEQEDLISKLNEEKFLAEKRVKLLEVSEDELTKKLESLFVEYNALKYELETLKNETVPKDHLVDKETKVRELQEQKEMLETDIKQLRSCVEDITKRMDFVLDKNNNLTAEIELVKRDKTSLEQQLTEEKKVTERKLGELELSNSTLVKKIEALLCENEMLKEQLQSDKEEAILLASDELEEKVKKELEISAQLDTSLLQSISASSEENECYISELKPSLDLTAVVHKAANIGIEGLNPNELALLVEHLCKAASLCISHSDTNIDYLDYQEMKAIVNRIASLEKTMIQTIQVNEKKAAEAELCLQQEKKRVRELQELVEKEHNKLTEMQNAMDVQTRAMFDLMAEKDILVKEGSCIEDRLQQHVAQLQGQKTRIKFLEEELQKEKEKVKQLQVQVNAERQRFKIDRINDADFIEKLRLRLETALTAEEKLRNELERERLNPKAHVIGDEAGTGKLQRQLEIEQQKYSSLELELKRAQEEVIRLHGKIETEYCVNKRKLETERYEKEQLQKELITQNSQLSEMKTEVTNLQEQLSLKTAEMEALERKIAIIRSSELRRRRSNEARQEEEKRQREALLAKQIKLRQKISDLEEEIAALKSDNAGRLQMIAVDASQTNKRMTTGEISRDENLLLRNNTESVLLLARLTTERYELQQKINELEDKLKRISNLQDKTEYDVKLERVPRLTNVRSTSVQTETDSKSVAVDSELDMEERVRYLFGRYLRAESYRKALIWQKRYLLVVLGGYLEPESKTISQLAQLSDSEEAKLQDKTSDSRKPVARFRSAALVVVALSRMHYLVQRWKRGRRTGNNAVLNKIFNEAALDSAPTSYHGARRRGSSASIQSWMGSQGHPSYGSQLRYSAEKEHHSAPSEKRAFQD